LTFTISGEGTLLGASAKNAVSGVGTVMMRASTRAGTAVVTAACSGLNPDAVNVRTIAGTAVKLISSANPAIITANGVDASLITCAVCDTNNNTVETAANMVTFRVSGEGNWSDNSVTDKEIEASEGIAFMYLKSTSVPGTATVNATSAGLGESHVQVGTLPGVETRILMSVDKSYVVAGSTVVVTGTLADDYGNYVDPETETNLILGITTEQNYALPASAGTGAQTVAGGVTFNVYFKSPGFFYVTLSGHRSGDEMELAGPDPEPVTVGVAKNEGIECVMDRVVGEGAEARTVPRFRIDIAPGSITRDNVVLTMKDIDHLSLDSDVKPMLDRANSYASVNDRTIDYYEPFENTACELKGLDRYTEDEVDVDFDPDNKATLTIYYDWYGSGDLSAERIANLKIFCLDPTLNRWLMLKNSVVNGEMKYVRAELEHLSVYCIQPFDAAASLAIESLSNYPNPFSGSTTFIFNLTNDCDKVTIRIYTVSGRLIKAITASTAVGYNEAGWNGTDDKDDPVANGVYFYMVTAERGEEKAQKTGKLMVIR